MEPLLIVGGVVGLAASVAAYVHRQEKKRTAAFAAFAEERGYGFEAQGPAALPGAPAFRALSRGRSRQFTNLVRGTKDDAAVLVGDYTYVVGSGKSRSRYRHTLCLVQSPALSLPRFFLRPQRRVLDALGKMLGGKDLNFDDDPEFSAAFVLQGEADDVRAVTRTFTPAVRSHFVSLQGRPFQLEAWGEWFLWESDRRLDVKDVEAVVVDAVNLRRILAYQARHEG